MPERPEIDRWLVSRAASLVGDVRRRMEELDLAGACRSIEGFVIDDLSNWYIRRNRRRFWKGELGADKLAAYGTLHGGLDTVTRLMAPMAPFLAELLWERLAGTEGSVHAELVPAARREELDPELEQSMQVVEAVVRMGRALRERAGVRVRQPLRSISVRSSDARALELLRSSFATHQVLDELNVKQWGTLEADDGELVRLRAKPSFRVLGKRLGPRMKAAAAAIESLSPAQVAALRGGAGVELELADGALTLEPGDVEILVESRASFDVETDGRLVVHLDTELDEELLLEGLAREVVIRVNALRKERGLAVEQRIRLRLLAEGERLPEALRRHRELVAAECLALQVELAGEAFEGEWSAWSLAEGEHLRASLAVA